MKELMAGMDLHSNNVMCGIMDRQGKRILHQRLPCDLKAVLDALKPYRERLDTIAVESTYNWYWLVDGLRADGYQVQLANAAGITQYSGLKHTDDISDAYFLAELTRLDILPTGYIYDPSLRPVRDLLRRRASLVQKRTSVILSLKSLFARTFGQTPTLGEIKKLDKAAAEARFQHSADCITAGIMAELMQQLDAHIGQIEKSVTGSAKSLPCYRRLQTLPGVGIILGLTISMETGPIERFQEPGNYASYCRCVGTARTSNGKAKGKNNGKNGNPHLGWAFVEAANFARRFDERCRRFFDRKAAATNSIVATKALACKLAKAAWWIMHQGVDYDWRRMFPGQVAMVPDPGQAGGIAQSVHGPATPNQTPAETAPVRRVKRDGASVSKSTAPTSRLRTKLPKASENVKDPLPSPAHSGSSGKKECVLRAERRR